jgi:ribosomal-protein-alanine N-acetyltransferase
MSQEIHRAMLNEDYVRADDLLGAKGLSQLTLPRSIFELRLEQLVKNPKLENWLLRAIVLRETNEVVGNIGFHTTPDASYLLEQGLEGLEYGYSVIEQERRKGFAKEASRGLMKWAEKKHNVRMFVLSIGSDNVASRTLARSLEFTRLRNYEHPERGTEELYTCTVQTP